MRPVRALATAFLVATVAVAGCGTRDTSQPSEPPPTVAPAPTPAPPTTRPPTAREAVATAIAYLRREVGMADPVAEPFRWTGATTGQVDVRARIRMSDDVIAVGGPVTTVSLQRLRTVWYVLGTSTSAIRVVDPRPRDVIRSPLPVMVVAPAVDGQVRVRVTADRYGRDTELGSATLTGGILGGGGEVAEQVPFGRPAVTTGSVVFTISGRNGEVWAATVVRVRVAKAQPPRILQVTTSPQLSKKDGWLLLPDVVSFQVTATGADRARLVSTPTGTAAAFYAKVVAEDTTAANGLRLIWHPEVSGYLTIKVTGPGGTATRELGSFYHE